MNRSGPAPARRASRATLALALSLVAGAVVAQSPPASDWHSTLAWQGHEASMQADAGGWRLRTDASGATAQVRVAPQPLRSHTASPLFDGLFALAQQELSQAQVESISDNAYDNGHAIACACFETGEKWRYVWTRDLSFAADLSLARLRPQRTRDALRFKSSDLRAGTPQGQYVVQDTGSGGSWPISSDRVVWFLAARGLVDGADADVRKFREQVWQALTGTLAQDRQYVYDADMGLYRGETSFLDWREQSYPRWTQDDVAFIAQSYALSTNVLHYQALRLGERMARERGDARATQYAKQADELALRIDQRFWDEARGLYMSYIGTAAHPVPFQAYDLLGLSLLVDSGIAPEQRARRALATYPMLESGSPVIWPQQAGIAIYHNRAIWPFVSAYSLRAARKVDDAARIEHEIRSILRGAALAGSNMENYELATQAVHVDDGALSGPVVNSPRQLWSVAGYLQMVMEGVFGLEADGRVAPKIPVALVPMLFGDRDAITLALADREIVLERPADMQGELLVAGETHNEGRRTRVRLVAMTPASALPRSRTALDAAAVAPPPPQAPQWVRAGSQWRVEVPPRHQLYVDGALALSAESRPEQWTTPRRQTQQCASFTVAQGDLISLHSPTRCVGDEATVDGDWPRTWRAPKAGRYAISVDFTNTHGPINTGITAAVKTLVAQCDGADEQSGTLVMPHGTAQQRSSAVAIDVPTRAQCRFTLRDGVNMSYLRHNAHYTGGEGGIDGPLNSAQIHALHAVALKEAPAP